MIIGVVQAHQIRGHKVEREPSGEPLKEDWVCADDIPIKKLWANLCEDGAISNRNCERCETKCAFGRAMLAAIKKGAIEPYSHHTQLRAKRKSMPYLQYKEGSQRAASEVKRVFTSMGRKLPDWQENLMEDVAKTWRKQFGKPNVDDFDTDPEILSAVIQAQGFHNFAVME